MAAALGVRPPATKTPIVLAYRCKATGNSKDLALAKMDEARNGEGEGHGGEELTRKECTRELPPP